MTYASLCFLSFDRPDFLTRALETAVRHAGEQVEVIVHDDGSQDRAAIDQLVGRVREGGISRLILNPRGHNEGQGVALNRMFHMASGDPIIKLDQDLVFKPGWLAKARQIVADENVGLAALFRYWHEPVDWRKTATSVQPTANGHSYHTHICGSGMVIPRRVWERHGPFVERWESFGEDWDFQRRISEAGLYCALPDEDLVENIGFGLGPSTVVIRDVNGQPTVRTIHKLPLLVKSTASYPPRREP
jgi:glycosyltransferase involved in cell wall biosynthesis